MSEYHANIVTSILHASDEENRSTTCRFFMNKQNLSSAGLETNFPAC